MKKLILILSLALSISAFTQIAPPPQKVDLHLEMLNGKNILDNSRDVRVGPVMMLGGASFIAAGLLTTPVYVGGSTTEKKPFLQQGGRAAAIISGCIILSGGIVISLNGY